MGLARSQNYLFVKVGTCPLFAHSQMLLGLATSSADIVANGRYRRMARFRQFPWPWERMNAGRRQTPRTKRTVKSSALVFRLRAPEIFGRGSWPNRPGTYERLEKPRESDRGGSHAYSHAR